MDERTRQYLDEKKRQYLDEQTRQYLVCVAQKCIGKLAILCTLSLRSKDLSSLFRLPIKIDALQENGASMMPQVMVLTVQVVD